MLPTSALMCFYVFRKRWRSSWRTTGRLIRSSSAACGMRSKTNRGCWTSSESEKTSHWRTQTNSEDVTAQQGGDDGRLGERYHRETHRCAQVLDLKPFYTNPDLFRRAQATSRYTHIPILIFPSALRVGISTQVVFKGGLLRRRSSSENKCEQGAAAWKRSKIWAQSRLLLQKKS